MGALWAVPELPVPSPDRLACSPPAREGHWDTMVLPVARELPALPSDERAGSPAPAEGSDTAALWASPGPLALSTVWKTGLPWVLDEGSATAAFLDTPTPNRWAGSPSIWGENSDTVCLLYTSPSPRD